MAKVPNLTLQRDRPAHNSAPNEEDRGLLSGNASDDDDIVVHEGGRSVANDDIPKTPRSAHRVRFNLPPPTNATVRSRSVSPYDDSDLDRAHNGNPSGRRDSGAQQEMLLLSTDPSRAWADSLEHLSRPKSSLRSAISNMANSIIGAGIIGQPYALRQAGLLTGVTLLIVLTVTVDWTIRLIVINSKLSGRDSFQGTVEHCFGKPGLIAISVAQWAFAFGGMVAFGVIVGDSIPHVLEAVWPDFGLIPVIGLLAHRNGAIAIFIMAISWPLSLYRDIAKVCCH
jgi:sodium-coupled neutral amino acid transporter 11